MGCCKSTSELGELEVSMTRCFFRSEESGVELPNDFKFFDQDKHSISHNLDILTSNNYVNKLSEYIAQKKDSISAYKNQYIQRGGRFFADYARYENIKGKSMDTHYCT